MTAVIQPSQPGRTGDTTQALIPTPLGELRLVATPTALTAVYFPRHLRQPPIEDNGPVVRAADHPVLSATEQQLREYFAGARTDFDLPLAARGNEFQVAVWALLRQIPYGVTWSYGQLAARLGQPGAAQAVGTANARNPVSIIVPCHRVIGSDGSLTGYAGGLERKRALLVLEGVLAPTLFD